MDNSGYIKDPSVREAILKVKVYRVFSYIFFGAGFLVFLVLYNSYMDGKSLREALHFTMLGIVALPFLPAAVLAVIAHRSEKDANTALESYYEEEERRKAERIKAANENMMKAMQQKQENAEGILDPESAALEEGLDAALEHIAGVGDDPSQKSG
ncbi:MAG: hypothetical protein NZ828_02550 [Alphaproteobacteria bacterium]|nr:hypothetical protein [Alphaproteobacteria bacterium]